MKIFLILVWVKLKLNRYFKLKVIIILFYTIDKNFVYIFLFNVYVGTN